MNREEAIICLQGLLENPLINKGSYLAQAIEMAIKALSQEPCDDATLKDIFCMGCEYREQGPCENAISRQAVRHILNHEVKMPIKIWKKLFELVDCLPPATPQQKYGKWIEHPEIETSAPEYLMFYECSECGNKPCFCKSDIHKKRFCSNCGCRMVEPQERSEKE